MSILTSRANLLVTEVTSIYGKFDKTTTALINIFSLVKAYKILVYDTTILQHSTDIYCKCFYTQLAHKTMRREKTLAMNTFYGHFGGKLDKKQYCLQLGSLAKASQFRHNINYQLH